MTPSFSLPASTSPNLAEAKALEKHVETTSTPCKPFNEWLRTKCQELEGLEESVWKNLHLVWEMINHFLNGDQLLVQNHRYGGWTRVPLSNNTASAVRQQNKLGFYSRRLLSAWVASRTKVVAIPGDDSDEAAGAGRAAQVFIDALEQMLYSEDFRQREALAAQAHGTYARYFYYDSEADDGGYGYEPVTEQREFGGGDSQLECAECGYVGPMAAPTDNAGYGSAGLSTQAMADPLRAAGDSAQPIPDAVQPDNGAQPGNYADGNGQTLSGIDSVSCPQCGNPNTTITPAASEQIEVLTGVKQYKLGRLKGMTVPYSELRHELSQSAEESPWLRWKRRIRKEELKARFEGIKFEQGSDRDGDTGLRMERRMQRSLPQSRRGIGSHDSNKDYAEFSQWWFAPCMYSDYTFPVDVQTVAGETIPAGSKASELFPDGMYVARVEGMDAPLQVRNECHKHHWVTSPYHIRNFTKLGLGINDAVEMQRQWNVVLSLIFEQIRTAAVPGYLYDKDAIDNDDVRLLGQPQNNVPVSTRNREPGTRLNELVQRMEPGTIPSHLFAYIQQLDANMQTIAGALVNQGVPGAEGDTATAATIFDQASKSHNLPEYALKGDADVRSMECCFGLAKKFYVEPRYLPLKGKRGKQDGIWLSAADLGNGQIRFEAVKDSYLPNTRADKLEAIKGMFLACGGVQGFMLLVQSKPDAASALAREFGFELEDLFDNNVDAAMLVSRQRVDQILQLAPQYAPHAQQAMTLQQLSPQSFMQQGQVDPATGIQGPPTMIDPIAMIAQEIVGQLIPSLIPEEPAQQVSIEWLRSWLLDDQGKEADQLTRACVQALIHAHIQNLALEAQVMSGMQQAANPQPPPVPPQQTEQDKRKDNAKANMGGRPQPQPRPQQVQQGAM